MYKVVHLSAECYPIAKTGGLGDVVGALPKYLNQAGYKSCVVLPFYNQKWNQNNTTELVRSGNLQGHDYYMDYQIRKVTSADYGFDVFMVHIPEMLFRENVYGYGDDPVRFMFFQHAALDWINQWMESPSVLHCHDHHTGLIPFMVDHCFKFTKLRGIKTVFTIHNGLYTGACSWSLAKYIPDFSFQLKGYLDWGDTINPLAAGIKSCHYLTTVSHGYLDELKFTSGPMQWLYNEYWEKSKGIVNGIDNEVWNPATDNNIAFNLKNNLETFKQKNKAAFCESVNLNPMLPLMVFIGRLVQEKGGELLSQAIGQYFSRSGNMNFFVLGSGATQYEEQLKHLSIVFGGNVSCYIGYNEALAHQIYAAADFLIMPSLIEPCGLNQLYAMQYGTIPVVRSVGGLKDTVVDVGDYDGYGIRFNEFSVGDILYSMQRAADVFENKTAMKTIRTRITELNFSWEIAVKQYIEIYNK